MSQNILIDGKPLQSLRVVDLREELKKRGIKASGTKSHLQCLLISAIQSVEETKLNDKIDECDKVDDKGDKNDLTSNDENSNDSSVNSGDEPVKKQKFASISINEEKETIKLTIRSSPRKSQPSKQEESESESDTSISENDDVAASKENTLDTINSSLENKDDSQDIVTNEDNSNNSFADNDEVSDSNVIKNNVSDSTNGDDVKVDEPVQIIEKDNQNNANLNESEEKDSCEIIPKTEESNSIKIEENVKGIENVETELNSEKNKESELELKSENKNATIVEKKPLDNNNSQNNSSELKSSEKEKKTDTKEKTEIVTKSESIDAKSRASLRGRVMSISKHTTEDENKDSHKPVQKKRRWGSSASSEASVLKKGISSDKLKQLINESVIEDDNSTKVSKPTELSKKDILDIKFEDKIPEIQTNEDVKISDVSKNSTQTNILTKKTPFQQSSIENVNDNLAEIPRSVSPAKNPESTVLFVTGLVRPYTLIQLKKLLSATGTIDEEKFWIDKIKSKCYVTYSSVEEAVNTRKAIHNLKWPQSSPKNLSVEFATLEDIDRCLHPENYEDLPLKSNKPTNNNKIELNIDISKGKYDIILNEPKLNINKEAKEEEPTRFIREWDRNKVNLSTRNETQEELRKRPRQSPVQHDKRDRSEERSKPPEKVRRNEESNEKDNIRKSESPAKLLENLFRKTKATPYIYWLPLTDDQIVEKERQRAQIEKDRDNRIAVRREMASKKRNDSPIKTEPQLRNLTRERPKYPDNRRRSPSPQYRRKRSPSPSPRRFSRYSRSRSPDRRRFSPRRRR